MPTQSSADATLLLASNRGPLSFRRDEFGRPTGHRGGGGLVSGLIGVGQRSDHATVLWVCAALTDVDRLAAREAPGGRLDLAGNDTSGVAVQMLDIDRRTYDLAYNGVANSTLWFLHHMLYATPVAPVFDAGFRVGWASYEAYGQQFAQALATAAAPGAKVLVQDYHLTLTPRFLRALRPDLRIAHFSHTPWAPVDYFRLLPEDIGRQVLLGVLGADHVGFLAKRWAGAFLDCCEAMLDAEVDRAAATVCVEGHTTQVAVHALGIDAEQLRERACRPDVEARVAGLRSQVGDRRVIGRVDRTELSKNIVRGLLAYRELLRTRPEWQGRVVHLAGAYPSRHDLPEYREYTAAVQRLAREIEDEFATPDWRPLIVHVDDDYARSLATYRVTEVLLVNPVRDGMNLVAKEAPILAESGCSLVLSTEAGAAEELGSLSLLINPYDVSGTADALHRALLTSDGDRRQACAALIAAATTLPPQAWLRDQVRALDLPG